MHGLHCLHECMDFDVYSTDGRGWAKVATAILWQCVGEFSCSRLAAWVVLVVKLCSSLAQP